MFIPPNWRYKDNEYTQTLYAMPNTKPDMMKIIDKPISEQIIEKMIGKLKDSEDFTESILTDLESVDLTNKSGVKEAISKETEDKKNEDTES